MIWADRIGLAMTALVALCAAGLAVVLFIGVGTFSDARLNLAIVQWAGIGEAVFALPLWLLLRGFDLAAGGPWRRSRRQRKRSRERREPDLRGIAMIRK